MAETNRVFQYIFYNEANILFGNRTDIRDVKMNILTVKSPICNNLSKITLGC
jgi:hypothetical protein